eukprot:CAMPEP_0119104834 /NCGR_PEP_ID=MMETSP1180-20130426/2946_1 /TAXON_ID=3052 ORGANISM="Chlamydomonas cf sp, Strain CCMP681" /NCGR_SAMPLE_ID=MMETSP1180 /ASSEMBLY_ACC=CAM_ASM_000741 /LENGTH=159 /DNA_ID=CAMNT_0007089689 /DNA_START=1353 /DNA_END=1832 /DNA_ORIENTATION=-
MNRHTPPLSCHFCTLHTLSRPGHHSIVQDSGRAASVHGLALLPLHRGTLLAGKVRHARMCKLLRRQAAVMLQVLHADVLLQLLHANVLLQLLQVVALLPVLQAVLQILHPGVLQIAHVGVLRWVLQTVKRCVVWWFAHVQLPRAPAVLQGPRLLLNLSK